MGYIGSGPTKFNTADGLTVTGDAEFTGNASFGDSDKAIFGAGSDLQIYHDGSNSYVKENGTGTLNIQGTNLALSSSTGEYYLFGSADNATTLYHNNVAKLATAATGAQVTGSLAVDTITNASSSTDVTINTNFDIILNGVKVGIGTASPTKKVSASIGLNDTDGYVLEYSGDAKGGILLNPASGEVRMGALNSSGTYLPTFFSNNSESMRLDSTGNLIINDTASGIPSAAAAGLLHIDRAQETGNSIIVENVPQDYTAFAVKRAGTAGVIYAGYYINAANGVVGSITNSNTATAFNTSSDYRLKTAVTYDWDATTRLKQLKPARFKWIADGDTAVEVDGFLAHECGAVPEAITGTKDAMRDVEYVVSAEEKDADGNVTKEAVMGTRSVPDYQQIDQSKLVPLLCKTILELEARITALEGE